MKAQLEQALEQARRLCASNSATLLYLSVFGSALYGTSTGSSDLDLRGIFMPTPQSVVLGQNKKSLHFSTGKDDSKNSTEDLDIDLWSLQNWLLHLLPEGDTGAIDLLFSPSNSACMIMRSSILDPVFNHPLDFLDIPNNRSWIQYCYSQAKKYGIKGSHLGALRHVHKWLDAHDEEGRLEDLLDRLVASLPNDKYCFLKCLPEGRALSLCGKIHLGSIRIKEFRERIQRDMNRYGQRAREAEKNQGLDFKALSHALRSLDQMEELLLTGKIVYPLASRERLLQVKRGEIPWNELEKIILSRLAHVRSLHDAKAGNFPYDRVRVENFLLHCYGLAPEKRNDAAGNNEKELF